MTERTLGGKGAVEPGSRVDPVQTAFFGGSGVSTQKRLFFPLTAEIMFVLPNA